MNQQQTKKIVLNSAFEEVEKLEGYLNKLQEWATFDDEDYARIMLTLSEAVTNAIMHGNEEDPSKQVVVTASKQNNGNTLTIVIEDEGKGFNPSSIPDPLKEENLLKEGGRGVYLIEEYADEVSYKNSGSTLSMKFNLSATS